MKHIIWLPFLLILTTFASASPQKPNFIIIFIDDMGYADIGSFGSKLNKTPELDRMAAEGMKLSNFYAAPVCSASRAQLLTGCYAPRVSINGVLFPNGKRGLNPNELTIAKYLKKQGYATACIGKWHLGDQPAFLPTRHGFDSYFGIPYSNDMQRSSTITHKNVTPLLTNETVTRLLEDEDQSDITREYTERSIDFINAQAKAKKPFFLYLPHTAVHVPIFPHKEFLGTSENGIYGDWVAELDWSVGKILATLRKNKIEKNTLVIFTSDNGPWASRKGKSGTATPLRGAKGSTLEGGVRVPTLFWWSGKIHANTESALIHGTTDILPTLVSLAGGELNNDIKIDGINMTDTFTNQPNATGREHWHYFRRNTIEAIRSGKWKLAITPQNLGSGIKSKDVDDLKKPMRLYDLDTDIGETNDISAEHPEIVAQLTKAAKDLEQELLNGGIRAPGIVENTIPLYPQKPKPRRKKKKKN